MELKEGMRAIFKVNGAKGFKDDCTVVEISPSGKYVKLKYPDWKTAWWPVEDLQIIEILNPLK